MNLRREVGVFCRKIGGCVLQYIVGCILKCGKVGVS